MPAPDGNYLHVEMTWHGQVLMFGSADPRMLMKTPNDLGGSPVNFYLYCADVDAVTARARAAGATIAMEPCDQFYGDRISGIVDPDGHRWTFATHVRDVDFSRMPPPEHADVRESTKGEAKATDDSGASSGNGDITNVE